MSRDRNLPRRAILEGLSVLGGSRSPLGDRDTTPTYRYVQTTYGHLLEPDILRGAHDYILNMEHVLGRLAEAMPYAMRLSRGESIQGWIARMIREMYGDYDREADRQSDARRTLDRERDAALREREQLLQTKPFPGPSSEQVAAINAMEKEIRDIASKAMGLDPAFLNPGAKPAAPQPAPQPLPAPFTVDAQRADVLRLQGTTKGTSA